MSLTFLFKCNIPVSHKKPSGSKPYAFPTTLPWLWFPAKRPLVVSHCPWSTVTTSSIKASMVFNILGANNNCTLPSTKLDTITLSSRHGSGSPLLNPSCALLPCASVMSSAENFLLLTPPLAGIYSSPSMWPVQVFPPHPHPVQLPWPAAQVQSDKITFSTTL